MTKEKTLKDVVENARWNWYGEEDKEEKSNEMLAIVVSFGIWKQKSSLDGTN